MTEPTPTSPLSTPLPWDLVAEGYTSDVVPLFEVFAGEALTRLGPLAGRELADVACGPGTLALLAARAGARVRALDFSPLMIERLRTRAKADGLVMVEAVVGDGMALPWSDECVDAAASMFGLMFFPDRGLGFSELHRVLRPGGRAVVSSWVPLSRIPLLAAVFGIFGELAGGPPPPARPMPLTEVDECVGEMRAAGFVDVEVFEASASSTAPSTADLVASMVRSNAPIALLRAKAGADWPRLEQTLHDRVAEVLGAGPHTLTMIANIAVGRRAGGSPRG